MKFFLFLTMVLGASALKAQLPDLLPTEGIKAGVHERNIGKIFFSAQPLSSKDLKEDRFIQTYTLTNQSNLYFVAFLDNSLTNYLHRLEPDLPADSLVKIGNYQFSLIVDRLPVYTSNLLPGAPSAQVQNTATSINRPLIDNKNGYGSWSESFWNRFLANGGDSVLTDGNHTLALEIRPYLNSNGTKTGPLIAKGHLKLNVQRQVRVDLSNVKLNKVLPYDGFPVSKEPFDQLRIKELKAAINAGVFKRISSVIVIKNGKLLVEEYFNGEKRSTLHDPRSVGKSFSSTLTGIAIDEGYVKGEEQTLKEFYHLESFDNYTQEKEATSIKELLTMSSGFDGDDEDNRSPGNEENMYPSVDWVRFTLNLPYQQHKAGRWHYFTAGVVLLGDILNKTVPGGLEAYADKKLFAPLHIVNYKWQYTPQQVPNTAGGIQMNALDLAKYGQLYKNGGRWKRRQVIPQEWVAKTLSKQMQISGRNGEYYGYLFWNKRFLAGHRSHEAFYCAGNGGNYVLLFKDLPLVVVITAMAYGQPYAHSQVARMLSEFILPAVTN